MDFGNMRRLYREKGEEREYFRPSNLLFYDSEVNCFYKFKYANDSFL